MEQFYRYLYLAAFCVLGIGIFLSLLRAILGPRIADRIMGINMVGTLSLGALAVLALLLKESWLLDVSLIYCILSFLAVVVLAQVYIAAYQRKRGKRDE